MSYRLNPFTKKLDYYESGGGIAPQTVTGSVDGINAVFTVPLYPIQVFLGIIEQAGGGDYTVSGAGPYTITFNSPPVAGSILQVFANSGSGSTLTEANGVVPVGAIDGINLIYTLPQTPANFRFLSYGNILTNPTDYSISGATITMVSPLMPGNTLLAFYEY